MPDQRAKLTDEFVELLTRLLVTTALAAVSDEERIDVEALPVPGVSTRVADGGSWLVIEWGGSSMAYEWEGSESDALEIVRSAGPGFAEDLSADYWISGGWRNHPGQDGGCPSG